MAFGDVPDSRAGVPRDQRRATMQWKLEHGYPGSSLPAVARHQLVHEALVQSGNTARFRGRRVLAAAARPLLRLRADALALPLPSAGLP
jgi:hypothetical protein